MKRALLALAASASFFACGNASKSNNSSAVASVTTQFVRIVTTCHTGDGKYVISVSANSGTGPERTPVLGASIRDADGNNVAFYGPLKEVQSSFSISFGHKNIIDQATDGADFLLAYPSTNTPYSLQAVLPNGDKIVYGLRFDADHVNQGALTCAAI